MPIFSRDGQDHVFGGEYDDDESRLPPDGGDVSPDEDPERLFDGTDGADDDDDPLLDGEPFALGGPLDDDDEDLVNPRL